MRRLVAFSLMVVLGGCSGDGSTPEASTTTTPAVTSTTDEFLAPAPTTAPVSSSTSTTTTVGDRAGGESISVTEKITITIIDPEDGG